MSIFTQIPRDISRGLSPELPDDLGTMDQHLDFILPKIIPYGEDLREYGFWLGKRWLEVRDEEGFHEAILHIFNPEDEYLLSFDGNVIKGSWRQLNYYNTLILEMGGKMEMFDVRFINSEFLIMTKHGDQARKGNRKYFVLTHEPGVRHLDWRNHMERLFNIWRENSLSLWAWFFFILAIGVIIYMSLS